MFQHERELIFLANNLQLVCYCTVIGKNSKRACRIEDFQSYSSKKIKKKIKFIHYIYSILGNEKRSKKQESFYQKFQTLIYNLQFLLKQIEKKNFSQDTLFMRYFKDFQVLDDGIHIISKFDDYINYDLIKLIQNNQIDQSDINVLRYKNKLKIIQLNDSNNRIHIEEKYQNKQFYLKIILYERYGFEQQIGQRSLIDRVQRDLWSNINRILQIYQCNYKKLNKQYFANWLTSKFTFDNLFCHHQEDIKITILNSQITNEINYHSNESSEMDYNGISTELNLLQSLVYVKTYLDQQENKFFQNILTQFIDKKIIQTIDLKQNHLSTLIFSPDSINDQQDENNSSQVQQIQNKRLIQLNNLEGNENFVPQFVFNPQQDCLVFYNEWWKKVNYGQNFNEYTIFNNLFDSQDIETHELNIQQFYIN